MRLFATLLFVLCTTSAFAQTRTPEASTPSIAAANSDRTGMTKPRRKMAGKRANNKRWAVRASKHSRMGRHRTEELLPPNLGFGFGL